MSTPQSNLNALSAFAGVAEEFCTLIDSLGESRPDDLYQTLEAVLSRLHLAILPVEMGMARKGHAKFEKLRMTHEQWADLAKLIREALASESDSLFKWHVELQEQVGTCDDYCAIRATMLWDDLADIYRDLRFGLALWAIGTEKAKAEAAWEWRLIFEAHWGNHLFRAMSTVHEVLYELSPD